MGLSSATFRSYLRVDTEEERNTVITTIVFLVLFVSISITIPLLYKSNWIAKALLGGKIYQGAIILVLLTTFFKILIKIPFLIMRAREESKKYATFSVLNALTAISGAIIFVVVLKKGFIGILMSQVITAGVFCIILLPMLIRDIPLRFSFKEAKELLSFGLPLIPAGIGMFIITLSDRYFLKHYSTLHQVGLYSLGYRFGEIIWFFTWAFRIAWPQFLFANEKDPDANSLYSKITTYYLGVTGFICLAVSLLSKEIIKIMAAPGFFEAYKVVPLIALSLLLQGLFVVGTVGINLKNKTGWLPLTVGSAAVINLILNYLWIPKYGMMGAALATLVAYFVQFLFSVGISLKFYPISYEYTRLIKIIVVSLVIYSISHIVIFDSIAPSIASKLLLISIYPVGLLAFGFFTKQESAYFQKLFTVRIKG